VAKAEADHPAIAERFSIGQSYQGRELWAIKISDNVATDEDEPEVRPSILLGKSDMDVALRMYCPAYRPLPSSSAVN
jgi:hypothetical protein